MAAVYGMDCKSFQHCTCNMFQILVPNASFTGHLAGILVGLAFTKTPVKAILDWPFSGNFFL